MCVQHLKLFAVIQSLEQTHQLPLATQYSLNSLTMSENAHTFIFSSLLLCPKLRSSAI